MRTLRFWRVVLPREELGYVVKELMNSDLIPAIDAALAGRGFVSQFSSEGEAP